MRDWITQRAELEDEWLGVADTEQASILGGREMETELSDIDELLLTAPTSGCPVDYGDEWELERLVADRLGSTRLDRRNPAYVRWVQRSLNGIIGSRLATDGVCGRITRSGVRRFQRLVGLVVDGLVGPRTERALIVAGASQPPSGASRPGWSGSNDGAGIESPIVTGAVGLGELGAFTRWYIDQIRAAGKKLDCADLAIEVWIRFAARYGLPISFSVFDPARGEARPVARSQFSSVDRFIRYVQGNVSARGLIGQTYTVSGGHRHAVSGDVYLWQYFNNRTGRPHRYGHTQLFYGLSRGNGIADSDVIRIVQGSLPPTVPQFRDYSATHFRRNFTAHLTTDRGREPHTARLVGSGPRRFKGFERLT